jgi:hypothetical protein
LHFWLSAVAPFQQTLNNDSVIKMVKMGFQETMIIDAINRSPGAYDTSTHGLIARKNAGVGSKAISAMVARQAASGPPTTPSQTEPATNVPSTAQSSMAQPAATTASSTPAERPPIFITDSSS